MTDTSNAQPRAALGIGGIIGDSFSLTFSNFFGMLALIILPLIIIGVSGYLLVGDVLIQSFTDPFAQPVVDPVQYQIMNLIWTAIMLFALSFFYAGAIKLIFDAKSGGRGSIGAAVSAGLSGMVRLFVMFLVMYIALIIVGGVLGGVVGGLVFATGSQALAIVIGVAFFVAFLWIMGVFAPFASIVVVENQWFGAIGRTFKLTAGYRWPIVGCFVVFSLAVIVVYLALALVGYVASLLGVVGMVLLVIVGIVGAVVIYGAGVAVFTLVYLRLREIKEGASVETLADVFS